MAPPAVVSATAPALPASRPAAQPADAAQKPPAPKPRGNAQAANDPPWPHAGSRAPAPATLPQPGTVTAPQQPAVIYGTAPQGDGLGPLRAALRQCDSQDNMLSKGVCVVRARHQHCGSNWGRVPECPMSNRNNDPYSN